jgi:hypothetical protein
MDGVERFIPARGAGRVRSLVPGLKQEIAELDRLLHALEDGA